MWRRWCEGERIGREIKWSKYWREKKHQLFSSIYIQKLEVHYIQYMTAHTKTIRKLSKFFLEIEVDFASPIFRLPLLKNFRMDSPFRC